MDNIRKDYHHKVANWITNNYDVISIGKLPKNIFVVVLCEKRFVLVGCTRLELLTRSLGE